MHAPEAARTQGDAAPRDAAAGWRHGAARWPGFAAAPTFAIMAMMAGPFGQHAAGMSCSAATDVSMLGGMPVMYLLMAVFHAGPWIALLGQGVGAVRRRAKRA